MKGIHKVVAVAIGIAALLVTAPVQAQETKQRPAQLSKRIVAAKKATHRLILQVNTNDAPMMNLALNNATNVAQYYKDLGEKVAIEIVTFGPGLQRRMPRQLRESADRLQR
jgi:isopentenyl diphosphate isomerase/L-lactate dehydrogenase-like FMN-dependent dehydrogenase